MGDTNTSTTHSEEKLVEVAAKMADVGTDAAAKGESFADKLKMNPDFQVAIFTEPMRLFTENDKLDFIDEIGNILYNLTEETVMPNFLSTVRRERYIIITAGDESSREWLHQNVPGISLWPDVKFATMAARDVPKLKKGLLWLPGRKKLENSELLKRIAKQNPDLDTTSWRVLSRHEEEHGTRLLLGTSESAVVALAKKENRPQWSTVRAQYTPVEELIQRKKDKRQDKRKGKLDSQGQRNESEKGRASKRKPDADASLDQTSPVKADKNPDTAAIENELLAGRQSPFMPLRGLARSPIKSTQRPSKKKRELTGSKDKQELTPTGKITGFFLKKSISRQSSLDNLVLRESEASSSPVPVLKDEERRADQASEGLRINPDGQQKATDDPGGSREEVHQWNQ